MPIHTLLPDRETSGGTAGGWTTSGAINVLHAISSIESDSWAQGPSSGAGMILGYGFPSWSPPPGAHINSVRWCGRLESPELAILDLYYVGSPITAYSRSLASAGGASPGNEYLVTSPWRSTDPRGRQWGSSASTFSNLQTVARASIGSSRVQVRIYGLWLEIDYTLPPSVSYNDPTGTITDNAQPTVTWDYSHPDNIPQARSRVVLSGVPMPWQNGASTSYRIPESLDDGNYNAVVQSQIQAPGGQWVTGSDNSQFTVDLDRPADPVLTVTPHNDEGRTLLEVFDPSHDEQPNLLGSSDDISSGNRPPWETFGVVPMVNGQWNVPTTSASFIGQEVDLEEGEEYELSFTIDAVYLPDDPAARVIEAYVTDDDPSTGGGQGDGWVIEPGLNTCTVRFVATGDTEYVWIGFLEFFTNGQVIEWVSSELRWTGDESADRFEIDYWDIATRPDGGYDVEWHPLRGGIIEPDSEGVAMVWDHEAPIQRTRRYRVRSIIEHEGAIVTSDWVLANGNIDSPGRWLSDPRDPVNLHAMIQITEHSRTLQGRDEVHAPAGMDVSVVESEPPTLSQTVSIWSLDDDTYNALWRVWKQSRTLLYRDWRHSTYVRLVGDREAAQVGLDGQETDIFTCTMVEVPRPPVEGEE